MYVYETPQSLVSAFSKVLVAYVTGDLSTSPEEMARHLLALRRLLQLVQGLVQVKRGVL